MKLTQEQRSEICTRYENGESSYVISRDYPVAYSSVKQTLKRRGVKMRDAATSHRRYDCNFRFFQNVSTEPQAYWLGFFAADGHVHPKNNTAAILLSKNDKDHLEKFKLALNATHPINDYLGDCPNGKYTWRSRLSIQSADMVNDLIALGVVPNKSLIIKWTTLPHSLVRHYLRGYIDGNGTFTYNTKTKGSPYMGIASSTYFLEECQKYLMVECRLPEVKILIAKNYHPNAGSMRYGGRNQLKRIYDHLYTDATVWMDRKKAKIEYMISDSFYDR